ncbi:IclR-family transcriptional regulator [Streptomyces hygroscopicus subsp. jinggangensis 5008]|nr:IclR-family transcriptional regulator [Streptomyces hygroscopicus subsp. jinggangensis 5008]AGF68149.1 IclR-family transcriptional regulator [Streptomyces hygroscopicus subsp. jinggangensis TL01]
MATAPTSTMRSLDRAFDVLGVLEDTRQPLRLSEIARRADLHVATTQRILNVLVERGYAAKEDTGYVAGPAAVATAHAFLVNNRLNQVALPVLQELAATTGLTASLFVRVAFARVLIARVQGRNPLRYQLPIGEKLPLTLGAGKALAAWLPEPELQTFITQSTPFTRISGEQVTADALAADLSQVRTDGYALSLSERALNVVAVSAPIRRGEETLAALSVSGSDSDLAADDRPHIINEVRQAAGAIATRCP